VTELHRPDRADRAKIKRVAEAVRRKVQSELDRHVKRYGTRPYQGRSLVRALKRARRDRKLGRILPTGWPVSFVRFDRNRRRPAQRGPLDVVRNDWDLLGFYLPLGWPLLSLTRAFRRPPYGYRGLSRAERQLAQGKFVWHLDDRPLATGTKRPLE